MRRIDKAKLRRSVERVKAKESEGEELARELNVLLRTTKYPNEEERDKGIQRCVNRVGKENLDVLMGRQK